MPYTCPLKLRGIFNQAHRPPDLGVKVDRPRCHGALVLHIHIHGVRHAPLVVSAAAATTTKSTLSSGHCIPSRHCL